MNKSIQKWFVHPVLIAGVFWTIDGLLYFAHNFFPTAMLWIITKTILLTICPVLVLVLISKKWAGKRWDIIITSLVSVFCIWFLSAFYFLVMTLFSKNGILPLKALGWALLGFPFAAIEVSTYSGGLFGLFAVTIVLPVASLVMKRKDFLKN